MPSHPDDPFEALQADLYSHHDDDDEVSGEVVPYEGDTDDDSTLGSMPVSTGGGGRVSGVRAMANKERRIIGIQLRRQGMSWKAVAEKAGYASAESARTSVLGAMHDLEVEEARDMRLVQHLRYEHLLTKHWAKAEQGNVRSGMFVLNVLDRINKLWGLDDYVRLDTKTELEKHQDREGEEMIIVGGSHEEYMAAAQKLIDSRG